MKKRDTLKQHKKTCHSKHGYTQIIITGSLKLLNRSKLQKKWNRNQAWKSEQKEHTTEPYIAQVQKINQRYRYALCVIGYF